MKAETFRHGLLVLAAGFAAGVAAAVLLTIVLALVDLYLSGHSLPVLSRPWLVKDELGVSMSRADVILLFGSAAVCIGSGAFTAAKLRG